MRVECNPLPFQPQPLGERSSAVGAETDHSARIDHAMPRNACGARQRVECIADEPRLAGQASERGHLSIRCDPSAWDATDDDENA